MKTRNSTGDPTPFTLGERLLADILALPDDAVDDCTNPYEAVLYARGELDQERCRTVEHHRESCVTCADFLDGIQGGLREVEKERRLLPWLKDQLQKLADPLRKHASNIERRTSFGNNVVHRTLRLPLALPGEFRPVLEGQVFDTMAPLNAGTPDQRLRWRIVDERAEVVVTFDSEVDDLAGMLAIRLRFGQAVERVAFTKCAGRIVGTATFSKVQLGGWTVTDVLQLEFEGLDEEPDLSTKP